MVSRHTEFDVPIDEWIETYLRDLENDVVGLWAIVKELREGFLLSGDELQEFVRLTLVKILSSDAKPVVGVREGSSGYWQVTDRYGSSPDEISNAVVEEWIVSEKDPDLDDLWFAKPREYNWRPSGR